MTLDRPRPGSARSVAVLGAGSWGPTFAKILADAAIAAGDERVIRIWGRRSEVVFWDWLAMSSLCWLSCILSGARQLAWEWQQARFRTNKPHRYPPIPLRILYSLGFGPQVSSSLGYRFTAPKYFRDMPARFSF